MSKTRILFLGNSHTYWNDMPAVFSNICKDCGKDVDVDMLAGPGTTYDGHLRQRINLRYSLVFGNYDYMIMQQAAHTPLPPREETVQGAIEIVNWAKKYNVKTLQWVPFARTNKLEEQAGMYDIYNEVHEKTGMPLIPVGNLYELLRNTNPEIQTIQTDGCHPSPYGTYLNALCTYVMIFGKDIQNARAESIEYFGGLDNNIVQLDENQAQIIKDAIINFIK